MKKFLIWQSRSIRTTLCIAVISGVVFSCNNDNLSPNFNQPSARNELGQIVGESEFDLAAKTLAKTLSDPTMRAFVKAEAAKKFDGDYNILYANVAERMIGGKPVNQSIKQ